MDDRIVGAGRAARHLVVYTDATTIAGAEHAVGILIAHLPPDIEVTVVGPDPAITTWIASHRAGCRVAEAPPLSTIRHLHNANGVRRALKVLGPTAIHLNKTEVAGLRYVELVCRALGCRVVSVVHHVERPVTPTARWLTGRLAATGSATVAVSSALAVQLGEILGLEPGRISAIPNAVETSDAVHEPDPSRFTIGVLSRFVAHKCLDHILEAVAKVPDAHLVIGGSGPDRDDLERLTAELGIDDRVEFLGWVDPDEVLNRCNIVALASRIEGHPLTLLDAHARGIPAVATDVGGVAEIVADGETGYIVPYGDIEAMAAAFTRLAADPALVEQMGAAARRRTETGYGPDAMAAAYLELYWPTMSPR